MEDLGVFVEKFATEPKPIHTVYELVKAEEDAAIIITELTGIEKFKSLRSASETNLYFQKIKRFDYLIKMAKSIQVFKVIIPWDIQRLNEVYETIVKHSKNIKKDN